MPSGGNFSACNNCGSTACQEQLFERVACDDTNGDGIADVQYTAIWAVPTCSVTADARLVGTFLMGDFAAPYVPVNPVDCSGLLGAETPGEAPIETVGLCLADGTPIAVTVLRDCDGIVTQTGWINLTTGTFSPGNPPAGTIACGGGQSIQVAGVFCDVLPGGVVAGLVLVEYHYAADGSISSVRLVNAATGVTYVLQGTLQICPEGSTGSEGIEVEQQPLCVVDNATGASLQAIVAEFRYDVATGGLLGVQYVDRVTGGPVALPAGAHLDVCPDPASAADCRDCETVQLCDVRQDVPGQIASNVNAAPNVWNTQADTGVRWMRNGNDPSSGLEFTYFAGATDPQVFWFDRPVGAQVIMGFQTINTPGLAIPAGWTLVTLNPAHSWDPVTRVLGHPGAVGSAAKSTFRVDGAVSTLTAPVMVAAAPGGGDNAEYTILIEADVITPFLQTTCRDCDGVVLSTVRTTLDGVTPYVPVGVVASCNVLPPQPQSADCETASVQTLQLCDLNPATPLNADGQICPVPFLRQITYSCDGAVTVVDVEVDGVTPYTPAQVVSCGDSTPPSLVELAWPQTGVVSDPALPGGADWIYTITNPETSAAATVHLHASEPNGSGCVPAVTPEGLPIFNNPVAFTLDLSPAALAMTRFRLDFNDLDNFEGINNLTPRPDSVVFATFGGTYDPVTGNIRTDASGNPGPIVYAYWNTPPAQITWGTVNNGGGLACGSVQFQGATLIDGPPCGSATGCSNCETVQLCDLVPAPVAVDVSATAIAPTPYMNLGINPIPLGLAPTQTLIDTGEVTFGAAVPVPQQFGSHRYAAARLELGAAECGEVDPAGNVTITVSGTALNNGPVDACAQWGRVAIWNGAAAVAVQNLLPTLPAGGSFDFTVTGTVPVAAVVAGQVAAELNLEVGGDGGCGQTAANVKSWDVTGFEITAESVVAGCGVEPFLRTICRDCDGVIVSNVTTSLDGVTPYVVAGEVSSCEVLPEFAERECRNCETVQLCDVRRKLNAVVPNNVDTSIAWATLSNGVGWRLDGNDAPRVGGALDFSAGFDAPNVFHFDRVVDVQIGLSFTNGDTAAPMYVPPMWGEPTALLPAQHSWDPETRILSPLPANVVNVETLFRLPAGSSSVTAPSLTRAQTAGQDSFYGDIFVRADSVTPFLRTICRDCDGAVLSNRDTLLDGTTPYAVAGEVMACDALPPELPADEVDCCQPVQVCIRTTTTQTVEFVTNDNVVDDGSVDPNWTWAKSGPGQTDPSTVAQWFPMYNKSYNGQLGGAWATTDSDLANPAGWSSPHPNARINNNGLPGEGPSLVPGDVWWARTNFTLPAAADPGSIKVRVSVLNADQIALGYKWNNAAAFTPGGGPYTSVAPYTTPAMTIPGVVPGVNTLYFQVGETSSNPAATNGAGVKAHFFVTYDLVGVAQRSWTRMICCDGSEYFLDEDGVRQDVLPDGWEIVPCGGAAVPVVLCDDNGSFVRHYYYSGDQVVYRDTTPAGGTYAPIGTVHDCSVPVVAAADAPVSTGIRRLTGDTPAQLLKTEFPGLQSVSISVLTGPVAVTMTNGAGVTLPAGYSGTWSVRDTDDSSLALASFDGGAGSDYLLAFTYKPTVAG